MESSPSEVELSIINQGDVLMYKIVRVPALRGVLPRAFIVATYKLLKLECCMRGNQCHCDSTTKQLLGLYMKS